MRAVVKKFAYSDRCDDGSVRCAFTPFPTTGTCRRLITAVLTRIELSTRLLKSVALYDFLGGCQHLVDNGLHIFIRGSVIHDARSKRESTIDLGIRDIYAAALYYLIQDG